MQVNPYLFYNGNCEAAFKFYAKVLGAKVEMMLRNEEAPADMPSPPDRKKKIMHAPDFDRWRSADGVRCASRALSTSRRAFRSR